MPTLDGPARLALISIPVTFGASGAVLALMGVGLPFLLGALLASLCAALVIFAAAPRPAPAIPDPGLSERVRDLEARASTLRHDLRGVLSPALMMADRLLRSEDPGVRRAGETVVRSVERATALMAEDRRHTGPAPAPAEPAAAAIPLR